MSHKSTENSTTAQPADQYPSLTASPHKLTHPDSVKKRLPGRNVHFDTYGLIPLSFHWIKLNQATAET